uniref:Uncharacterized protein n=1 Tax=Ananas comosus var. bracteatus TaxID=296719 RepID=A0A6V7QH10_ANACO|nr:unnamed protein product [Ananas comosus var. bracteatus]
MRRICWRAQVELYPGVIDCVPTYGTCPEECGTKPCTKTQKFGFWSALGLAVWRACTGTRLGLYRYRAENSQTRASGLHFRRSCTGTRMVLYRYNVDGCTGTAIGLVPGCFCVCGSLISAPTSLGPFFELSTAGKKLGAWVWSLIEEDT